jgi:hypothetical protein
MGNLKNKRKYAPCCRIEHIERLETLEISEKSNVLGDEGFIEKDRSGDDDEEDLEVLAHIQKKQKYNKVWQQRYRFQQAQLLIEEEARHITEKKKLLERIHAK